MTGFFVHRSGIPALPYAGRRSEKYRVDLRTTDVVTDHCRGSDVVRRVRSERHTSKASNEMSRRVNDSLFMHVLVMLVPILHSPACASIAFPSPS